MALAPERLPWFLLLSIALVPESLQSMTWTAWSIIDWKVPINQRPCWVWHRAGETLPQSFGSFSALSRKLRGTTPLNEVNQGRKPTSDQNLPIIFGGFWYEDNSRTIAFSPLHDERQGQLAGKYLFAL